MQTVFDCPALGKVLVLFNLSDATLIVGHLLHVKVRNVLTRGISLGRYYSYSDAH